MANELTFTLPGLTGSTLFAVLRRADNGQAWDDTLAAWEAWADGSIGDYAVALTEQGSSGRWLGTKPAGVTVPYSYEVCLQAGGSPAVTDAVVGVGDGTLSEGATLSTAALLALVQTDTGETTAADGSVAKIAQGATDPEAIAAALVGSGFAVVPAADLDPGELGAYTRATIWTIEVDTGTIPADRTRLWFTIKRRATDTDEEALVQVDEDDGLAVLLGVVAATPGDGSVDYAAQTVTIVVKSDATTQVPAAEGYSWDIKYADAAGEGYVPAFGTIDVAEPVTHRLT